jgi:hypothetical protein
MPNDSQLPGVPPFRSSACLGAAVAIATSRRLAEHGDISTAWYVLRDLEATKSAGLSDLAWSGHQQGDVTERELNDFIAELEAWMKAPNAEVSEGGAHG